MSAIDEQPEQPVCIHFINTVSKHDGQGRKEVFSSFQNFLTWGVTADLVSQADAARWQKWARTNKGEANQVLAQVIAFREYLFNLFTKSADWQRVNPAKLSPLNKMIGSPSIQRTLRAKGNNVSEYWSCGDDSLTMLRKIALSASDVLLSGSWKKIIECDRDECDWLAIDTSKNHSRRYCSAVGCGNLARVTRHYQRHKGRGRLHGSL
jgi:predicted RNA-binding Zn ribbon-like protein